MTLGQKIKTARQKSGLSQEQLSEKISVSRSAVAKWETDKGTPDIQNLKALAALMNVSIEYLLDDGENIDFVEMKEQINLEDYQRGGRARCWEDACVMAKFPDAKEIHALFRQKKLSAVEKVLDFLTVPGIFNLADSFHDMSSYYLVEYETRQYFVNVTKEFIISKELPQKITNKKFVINNNQFKKFYKIVG